MHHGQIGFEDPHAGVYASFALKVRHCRRFIPAPVGQHLTARRRSLITRFQIIEDSFDLSRTVRGSDGAKKIAGRKHHISASSNSERTISRSSSPQFPPNYAVRKLKSDSW
jgi:hypothetical protein